jgi:4-coumarate--CoA ligase (photoactive yellow protein activation family)
MTDSLTLTENDVLHVVQSMAQSRNDKSDRQACETSLFQEMRSAAILPPAQREELASEALHFFSLPTEGNSSGLRVELARQPEFDHWAKILFAQWDKTTICFSTSGSTGMPTRHCFPIDLLAEEIISAVARYRSRQRIISVMPVHHSFGMKYGPLLANYLNLPLCFAPMLPSLSFFAMLRPGDFVVAFPLFWEAVLTMCGTGNAVVFPPDVAGMTSTSPCPPDVLHNLITPRPGRERPLLTAITEIYGSTETSGMGMRCDGGEWYELFTCWESLIDAEGVRRIRRVNRDGPYGQPIPLPDIVVWHDARRFRPERRSDNAVQVGGVNVYPEKIAATIRSHPLVRDCAVRLMRPEEGTRLKAFIVPVMPVEQATDSFGKDFHDWLAASLDTASRPKRIFFGDKLPVTAVGKAADWE